MSCAHNGSVSFIDFLIRLVSVKKYFTGILYAFVVKKIFDFFEICVFNFRGDYQPIHMIHYMQSFEFNQG